MKIPFNRPFLTGKETLYIKDAVERGKSQVMESIQKCQSFFEKKVSI